MRLLSNKGRRKYCDIPQSTGETCRARTPGLFVHTLQLTSKPAADSKPQPGGKALFWEFVAFSRISHVLSKCLIVMLHLQREPRGFLVSSEEAGSGSHNVRDAAGGAGSRLAVPPNRRSHQVPSHGGEEDEERGWKGRGLVRTGHAVLSCGHGSARCRCARQRLAVGSALCPCRRLWLRVPFVVGTRPASTKLPPSAATKRAGSNEGCSKAWPESQERRTALLSPAAFPGSPCSRVSQGELLTPN